MKVQPAALSSVFSMRVMRRDVGREWLMFIAITLRRPITGRSKRLTPGARRTLQPTGKLNHPSSGGANPEVFHSSKSIVVTDDLYREFQPCLNGSVQ